MGRAGVGRWAAARLAIGGAVLASVLAVAPTVGQAVTADDIQTLRVPALCGYPAGQLVDGVLPGTNPGFVGVDSVAVGDFRGGSRREAVVSISCNAGGVAFPQTILFVSSSGRVIAKRELGDMFSSGISMVRSIDIRRQRIQITVTGIAQSGEAYCCGTAAARLTYRWIASTNALKRTGFEKITERQSMKKLLTAINNDNATAAARWASNDVVGYLLDYRNPEQPYRLGRCDVGAFFSPATERECLVWVGNLPIIVGVDRVDFGKWKANAALVAAD